MVIFIVWIDFILLQQKVNLNCIKKRENKDFCNENMLSFKILEFNWYKKSEKAPFIFYTRLEFIIEKIDGCKSNPTSTAKAS